MKIKLNVLDFIIIFIVVAVMAAGGYLFTKVNKTSASKGTPVTVEFMMEVKNLSKNTADSFKDAVGKTVVYGTTNTDSGVITDVKTEPTKRMAKNLEDGTVFWDTYPDEYTVYVTVKSDIYENDKYFVGDSEQLRVGVKIPFSGEGVACPDATVLTINKLEGGLK